MKKFTVFSFLFLLVHLSTDALTGVFSTNDGIVTFRSDAPQELISATSNALHGLIDIEKRTFAFRVRVRTFKGFNSGLQEQHFNENYLESEKFPEITFRGKIIEQVDFSIDGKYIVRTKGLLSVHGVDQERIIKSDVIVQKGNITVNSKFNVLITDHDIKVPRVVHEKIASEIKIEVSADFKRKE